MRGYNVGAQMVGGMAGGRGVVGGLGGKGKGEVNGWRGGVGGREQEERMGHGYDSVKYDFDTERLPDAVKARIAVTLLAKDFSVVGSAWITKGSSCMVKFVSDDKSTSKSGMVGATHLEGSISRR